MLKHTPTHPSWTQQRQIGVQQQLMADPDSGAGALTPDAVQQMITATVNSVISARDKMSDKKREQDKLELKKMFEDGFAALKAAPASEDPAPGKKGGKDLEITTLTKRLDELTQLAETNAKRAAEERAKNRANAMRESVTQELARHNIEGARARAAIALLRDEGRLGEEDPDSDEPSFTFRGDDGIATRLADGVKAWATKNEAANLFKPPSGARGSGSRPGGQPGASAPNIEEARADFWNGALNALRGG